MWGEIYASFGGVVAPQLHRDNFAPYAPAIACDGLKGHSTYIYSTAITLSTLLLHIPLFCIASVRGMNLPNHFGRHGTSRQVEPAWKALHFNEGKNVAQLEKKLNDT